MSYRGHKKHADVFIEKLDNLTISDYRGLNSPGLTCYLNSVLQVLFMTEDFRERLKRCCSKDSSSIDQHLKRLFADLQRSVARTHDIIQKLGITNIYEQRDAAEYFEKILCLTSPDASEIFKGELSHKMTCLHCRETTHSRGFFWLLPIATSDSSCQTYSVEKGLKAFFKKEKACTDNKMFCNSCSRKQDAEFGCEMIRNPEILTVLLKRFDYDSKRRRFVKLHSDVDIPQTLHVGNCKYDLYAIVHHFGNLTGGHYVAQIRSFENLEWYVFDDKVVKSVKPHFKAGEKSLGSGTAYLLMYRKASTKTDGCTEGALGEHPEVKPEGRRDGAVGLHHPPNDGGWSSTHSNGDVSKRNHEEAFGKTMSPGMRDERLNQRGTTGDTLNCSPGVRRRSSNAKKSEEKLLPAVTTSSGYRQEATRASGKIRNASNSQGKAERAPWRV